MSERFYQIHDLVFSIAGESVTPTAEILWQRMERGRCGLESAVPEVRFIFRDHLESPGEPVTRIGSVWSGKHSTTLSGRHRQKMQCYPDACGGLACELCEGSFSRVHELFYQFGQSWRNHRHLGLHRTEALARSFLYAAILPVLFWKALAHRMVIVPAAAAIAPDGRGYLFPGCGALSKGALLGSLMESGWTYLGEEFTALHEDGTMYEVPIPVNLYQAHCRAIPGLAKRVESRMSSMDRMLWHHSYCWCKPQKLIRWVDRETVWSDNVRAHAAPLAGVMFLDRTNESGQLQREELTGAMAVRRMLALALHELRNLPMLCTAASAGGKNDFLPDLSEVLAQSASILSKAFQEIPLWSLSWGSSATPQQAAAEFMSAANSVVKKL